MQYAQQFMADLVVITQYHLYLGVTLLLVTAFLGVLVFDLVRRRRRARRHQRREPVTLRDRLLTPIRRAQAFRNDLKQLFHERSRRERRHRRQPPDTGR